jgi:hypothetical protein
LLIFTGCFNDIIQGQFSQPTELGYATIAGGLCLAANQPARVIIPTEPPTADEDSGAASAGPGLAVAAAPRFRGRSALAEQLHAAHDPEQGV